MGNQEIGTYQDRVVGFVDILGFADLVRRADKDPGLRDDIAEALGKVRRVASPGEGESDLRAQNFSDSLILSAADTPNGLWHLLLSIDALAWNLLQLGVLIRGAVTIGGMRHETDLVFGVGVNEAARLESTVAKMPRIILGARAFDAADRYANRSEVWSAYRNSRLLRDRDGVWYLNYLNDIACFNHQGGSNSDILQHPLCEVGKQIQSIMQSKLDRTLDQPEIYAKVEWFARYWNEVVAKHPDPAITPVIGELRLAGMETRHGALPFRSF
ncbi:MULTISPECIES: hypothetical protein [unclassified Aureimonas]|uniref:hypothetical protein n=1 Tax=unclassified Aureimonas TaxID=2615206 RepID=UPI00070F6E4D|nr:MULTISPECIES: hypothetical protein [unclassified Aureimonas]KQT60578.1 hypothetical protein ASG62_08050 [Aureimonas sp. Leaf427]